MTQDALTRSPSEKLMIDGSISTLVSKILMSVKGKNQNKKPSIEFVSTLVTGLT